MWTTICAHVKKPFVKNIIAKKAELACVKYYWIQSNDDNRNTNNMVVQINQ